MPLYCYRCEECEVEFEKWHGMTETEINCEFCKAENSLIRIPQATLKPLKMKSGSKPGDLVKKTIEEAKEELKEYLNEQSKKQY